MSNNSIALKIEGVSHSFGSVPVLRDLSLQVDAGEVHCMLGPSGSGKSTLLRLIAGLEDLQSGSITLGGRRVAHVSASGGAAATSVPPEHRQIGFVFQDYALFPHLSVTDNVKFGMPKPQRGEPDQREQQAEELLTRVDMAGFARAMPHTLSGGQQQRVALARALARRPAVMLLDEPFSGLDDRLRVEVRENTIAVLRAAQVATVIVTHDPHEAIALGDRISVVEEGRLLQTGSPRELTERSRTAQVARVFGAVNVFPATLVNGAVELDLDAELDVDAGSRESGAGKETVVAMIRAENFVLRSVDQAADGRDVVDLGPGRIADIQRSYGANAIRIELEGTGSVLRVIDSVRAPWQRDDRVAASVLREQIMVAAADD